MNSHIYMLCALMLGACASQNEPPKDSFEWKQGCFELPLGEKNADGDYPMACTITDKSSGQKAGNQ
ncbi:MAG: hypothetical protein JKY71_03890 [Alphaproteobacteria bacterium]|nr:hypothetical protein [Alphaproteobacteria bacterium]